MSKKKKFVEQEMFFRNCLAKDHILKNCESEVQYRISSCNKWHHTLLHEDIHLLTEYNTIVSITTQPIRHFCKLCQLQSQMETVLYIQKARLDTGSDATLLKQEIATKLGLKGSTKRLAVTNALSKTT